MTKITESTIENFTIELLEQLDYQYIYAPDLPVHGTQTGVEEADESWEKKPLEEYFELLGGFAFKSKDYLDYGK